MTWSQGLLVLAILAVFLLWRRARGQVAQMRTSIEQHRDRNTFTFDAVDGSAGRTFVVRDAAGAEVDPRRLSWSEHGLATISATVTGGEPAGLAPGTSVELIEDENGLAAWNTAMTLRIGAVAPEDVHATRERLAADEVGGCIVLREPANGLDRTVMLLLIHSAVDIEL